MLKRLLRDENGATAVEYALIATLVAFTIITILGTVSTRLQEKFLVVTNAL